jgi:predicted dehydrogenase
MEKKVGYGVLGLGVGRAHVIGALKSQGVGFVAICDANEQRLHKVGDEFNIPAENRFVKFEDMLARPDIDIVSVCTPSGLHGQLTIQALKAGKHVMTEKPLEITLERIDEMVQTAEREGRYLGCIFQNRLEEGNKKIKETVASGRIGKPILCNFELKWFRSADYYKASGGWRGTWAMDGGGAMMNQTIHTVDLMQWIMGPVKSVFAKTGTYNHDIETEDTAVAVVTFANGAIGTLVGTTCAYPDGDVTYHIHGSDGTLSVRNNKIEKFLLADDPERKEQADVLARYGANPTVPREESPIPKYGHAGQIQDMVSAVLENRPPLIQGKDGRPAVEIILALYESAKTGKEVFLPL